VIERTGVKSNNNKNEKEKGKEIKPKAYSEMKSTIQGAADARSIVLNIVQGPVTCISSSVAT